MVKRSRRKDLGTEFNDSFLRAPLFPELAQLQNEDRSTRQQKW